MFCRKCAVWRGERIESVVTCEALAKAAARADVVQDNPALVERRECGRERRLLVLADCAVEEAVRGLLQELDGRIDDVRGDEKGDDRVEDQPAGEPHEEDPDEELHHLLRQERIRGRTGPGGQTTA